MTWNLSFVRYVFSRLTYTFECGIFGLFLSIMILWTICKEEELLFVLI